MEHSDSRREKDHVGARHHSRGNHDRGAEWRQGPDQLAAVEGMWSWSGGSKCEANPMHRQISYF